MLDRLPKSLLTLAASGVFLACLPLAQAQDLGQVELETPVLSASCATVQIERLSLSQMVARTDNCVYGEIIEREVFCVEDGETRDLYFTRLVIEGESVIDGKPLTVTVTFPGGFVDDEHGVYNSEAPIEADTREGELVLAFYKWSDNMGGGIEGNLLHASHGGFYRTFENAKGRTIVQGRGNGYAIGKNMHLNKLYTEVAALAKK